MPLIKRWEHPSKGPSRNDKSKAASARLRQLKKRTKMQLRRLGAKRPLSLVRDDFPAYNGCTVIADQLMIHSEKFFTVVFRDLTAEQRLEIGYHPSLSSCISASGYSHAFDDRDELLAALKYAEAALADIGDAEREPGDDLEWCENRAANALPRIRKLIAAHEGKTAG
jgi:hypothetical protein